MNSGYFLMKQRLVGVFFVISLQSLKVLAKALPQALKASVDVLD